MATSDGRLARDALDALGRAGVRFAVLHREAEIADGAVTSDIDVVVEDRPRAVLARAAPAWRDADLHPIILWPYDVGGAATLFLATADGGHGVQLDLLFDPIGRGKYGVRSTVLLASSRPGERWRRLREDHEFLYLVRKRSHKRDRDRLHQLVVGVTAFRPAELRTEAWRLFSPRAERSVARALTGEVNHPIGTASLLRPVDAARRAARLRRPIGFWVECIWAPDRAAEMARALAGRFGSYLPHSASGPRPAPLTRTVAWWVREVAPIRWRPGLFASWAQAASHSPSADLSLDVDDGNLDQASRSVVRAMERRLLR